MVAGYVFGVDVGVASLGVALLDVDERGSILGIRRTSSFIYPSGGDETAERRLARASRNRYERRRRRLKQLRSLLCGALGAEPGFDQDLSADGTGAGRTSRVALRARGLATALSADDLARAVMHIARNRGMRLTRVLGDDPESQKARDELGQMARESEATRARMAAADVSTPGAFLHALEQDAPADHLRPATRRRRGGEATHCFLRRQVEDELRRLLAAQAPFHPGLTAEVQTAIHDKAFEEQAPTPPALGPCRYFWREQKRMRAASDLYQTKRVYEEVNNIRVRYNDGSAEALRLEERDRVVVRLLEGHSLKPAEIKKILGLKGTGITISLESAKGEERDLKGHAIRAAILGTPLEQAYRHPENRDAIDRLLRDEKDVEVLAHVLATDYGLPQDDARALATGLHLPTATAPMGEKATGLVLEELKADVISHTEAVARAGLPDPMVEGAMRERLPYYGEVFPHLVRPVRVPPGQPGFGHKAAPLEIQFGRIPNPVVHKAFNALRKVVNAIVKEEGPPLRIQVELARDMKKTQEEREEDLKRINRERRKNEEYDQITLKHDRQPSRKNRRRLRLWERQNKTCPYTGRTISVENLFDGTFDIDHVLPRSRTLDDSLGNLVVALEKANKRKGDMAPYEAFAGGYVDPDTGRENKWEDIVKRVRSFQMGWKLVRRFSPDAMERFQDQDAFRKRFETDTSAIARNAAQYLRLLCTDVRLVNGHIVSELRHQWGLSALVAQIQAEEDGCSAEEIAAEQSQEGDEARRRRKSRADHRHHMLDALVTAAVPLAVVQQLQTAAGRGHRREDGPAVPPPGGFPIRGEAERMLRAASVVHRRDHAVNKRLHQEMAWGVLARFADGTYLARRRVRLTGDAFRQLADLDSRLQVGEHLIQRLQIDMTAKQARVFWKAEDPVAALRTIADDLTRVRERILELYRQEPETENIAAPDGSEIRSRTRKETERLARALDRYRAESGRRGILTFERRTLVLMGQDDGDSRPKLAYETKGNAWLDIRRGADGKPMWEAVPRILAIRQEQEGEEDPPELRLFVDDTLEIDSAEGLRQLCRIVSLSTGDVQLLPVNDARPAKLSVHRSALRFTSVAKFLARNPVLVVLDPLGAVRWRSPRRNW
ncbi:MAG: type II CRISPR RNA-guided endonuclease Cas9 [Caenispirillum sp.]|nr:type II CRISPR RNA-guided endonuclease Cas9 [Caenispirillum sp.]